MAISRRTFGKMSLSALVLGPAASWPGFSLAANPVETPLHGLSAFGELKYSADFPHLSYANPDAPKGGLFNFGVPHWFYNQNAQTFDTLNSFVLKGSAPPRMERCFDSLMARAFDEPSAIYGLLAETVSISKDRNSYTFKLRAGTRFHDGSPLTAEDVAFTYETFKKDGHPDLALPLTYLDRTEVLDPNTVSLMFNGQQTDQIMLSLAVIPILSKTYYTAHDFTQSTMDAPLGSGPYKVGKLKAGNFIEYDRVEDYWGKDLGINTGRFNFDTLRIEFFRERQAAFEAFKKGKILYREEFTSKTWATEYDFPAIVDGRAKKQLFEADKRASMQGLVCNLRKEKLANPYTREAIGHCFDFEWMNANFFYGAYARNQSYFQNSDFMATGTPSPEELALLEPLRGKIPEHVFGPALIQPKSNGSGRDRSMLRKANELFAKAGWTRKGKLLVDEKEKPFTLELLIFSPSSERIWGKLIDNLKLVGVTASMRMVDPSQYQRRLEEFDFDLTTRALQYAASPTGEDIEQIFGSKYSQTPGAQNLAGIENPAIDALIAKINTAESRLELTYILRALDRVLRSTHSWIPNWHSTNHRVAYWDMFQFPEKKPDYWFPVEELWWFDAEKAKALGKG